MKDFDKTTKAEREAFISSFFYVLCDIHGVLWHYKRPIFCAEEAIGSLRNFGKKVVYVTNNSSVPQQVLYTMMTNLTHKLQPTDLICPSAAIVNYLKRKGFSKRIFLIGTPAVQEVFENAGFMVEKFQYNYSEESIQGYYPEHRTQYYPEQSTQYYPIQSTQYYPIQSTQYYPEQSTQYYPKQSTQVASEGVGAVVVDWDPNITNPELEKALAYLKDPSVLFITGASNKQLRVEEDLTLIGPGMYNALLEEMSGRKSLSFGKPNNMLGHFIREKLGIYDPSKVLVIGDSISEDMGFAAKNRFQKLLVLSGETTIEDVKEWKFPENYRPQYYTTSLRELYENLMFGDDAVGVEFTCTSSKVKF